MRTPKEIAEQMIELSIKKSQTKWKKLILLAVLAGIFVSLGGVASTIAAFSFSGTAANLVKGIVFPVGLAMVVVAGSELFTGNCLIFLGVLEKKVKVGYMFKNLSLVWIGNFLGSIIIAAICVYGRVFDGFETGVLSVAAAKSNLSFLTVFLKGIPCNILVCIAVWMMLSTDSVSGKIAAMYLPIMAFVICGFEHCVANMYYFSAGFFVETIYSDGGEGVNALGVLSNLLASTLGNFLGGTVFVALPYWVLKK